MKSADGACGKPTDTVCEVDAETPRSLVTVSVTTNVPEDVNTCVVVTPVPVAPSPKFHAYETSVLVDEHAPLGSVAQLVDASKLTLFPTRMPFGGKKANAAFGVPVGGRMTPGGTRRIIPLAGAAVTNVPDPDSDAVATMSTHVPATP